MGSSFKSGADGAHGAAIQLRDDLGSRSSVRNSDGFPDVWLSSSRCNRLRTEATASWLSNSLGNSRELACSAPAAHSRDASRARQGGRRGGGARPRAGARGRTWRPGAGPGGRPGPARGGRAPPAREQGPGGRGGPPIRQRAKKPPGPDYAQVSHGSSGVSLGILLALWTFPSQAYVDRAEMVKQYCLSTAGQLHRVRQVEIVHESCATRRSPSSTVTSPRTTARTRACTATRANGGEHHRGGAFGVCRLAHPRSRSVLPARGLQLTQATFTVPYNPNEQMFLSLVWLSPLFFCLLVSVHCRCGTEGKRWSWRMTDAHRLFNEVVIQRNHQEKFVNDVEMQVKHLKSAVDGEQQKRLDVVLEVEKERRDRQTAR